MAFIEKLVGPDEKLIGIARLHWIYGVKGLLWLAGFIALGGLINWGLAYLLGGALLSPAAGGIMTIGTAAFWVCLLIGACLFLFYFIMMLATEIGLTTERLIYKKGMIFVKTEGVDLEEIKGAFVDNEILGRFLNYGTIRFDARFINDLPLPAVADPYRFVKALNDRRAQMKEDGMRVILDGHDHKAAAQALSQTINGDDPAPKKSGEKTPSLGDPKYRAFDDIDPLAPLNDLLEETRETAGKVDRPASGDVLPTPPIFRPQGSKTPAKTPPMPSAGDETSGPVVFSELKEGVLEEFQDSTRH